MRFEKHVAGLLLAIAVVSPAAAEWSGNPYGGRQDHHIAGRPAEGGDVALHGRDVVLSPQGECWLVRTTAPENVPSQLKGRVRSQFIPFNTRAEFESYLRNNAQGQQAKRCAFNTFVELCDGPVGQTGHRALGTVVGPFTYDDGERTASITLRADRQGTDSDSGWSVISRTGSCEAGPAADCSDPAYAAAHPAQCGTSPRDCDDPRYRANHPDQCRAPDPYCPAGYTAHVVLELSPTYYDESGPGTYNPNTFVGCARTSPHPALATPVACPPSQHQSVGVRSTRGAPYDFPDVGFCGYHGSLDRVDYANQWGSFPTFCAHEMGSGQSCRDTR
jgi:hypothetical protein